MKNLIKNFRETAKNFSTSTNPTQNTSLHNSDSSADPSRRSTARRKSDRPEPKKIK